MNPILTQERLALAILALVAGVLTFALVLEHISLLEPCALCLMQRLWFVSVGLIVLAGLAHNRAHRVYATATIVAAAIGCGFAIRQLWLQSLPADEVPACGPGINYMIDAFPFADVLRAMVLGTGNCAEVVWRFLGLSIPGWSLVSFGTIILISLSRWLAVK